MQLDLGIEPFHFDFLVEATSVRKAMSNIRAHVKATWMFGLLVSCGQDAGPGAPLHPLVRRLGELAGNDVRNWWRVMDGELCDAWIDQ